ncbi:MAG: hypothetical protein JWR78_4591 [Mycobacterium sp.]|jgi:hypothetical protein|nr:hypothetical protein [Mycobacterium sp.]MDT5071596.1 hypothetical protein [Mycobacterium sp.]
MLHAVANCPFRPPAMTALRPQPMVGLLIDGLRYGAEAH